MKEKIRYKHEFEVESNSIQDVHSQIENVLSDLYETANVIIPAFNSVTFEVTKFEVKYIAQANKTMINLESEVIINEERKN